VPVLEVVHVLVSLVRFRSTLADADVRATFEERAERFRQLPGLIDKIYLRFRETGEFGAVYVWESDDALARFRESELARTIPTVYQVDGTPQSELADVCLVVTPEARETVSG
jgi:hypothetical protein